MNSEMSCTTTKSFKFGHLSYIVLFFGMAGFYFRLAVVQMVYDINFNR